MRIEATRSFEAPRESVWSVLCEPTQLAGLVPGVAHIEAEARSSVADVRMPLGVGDVRLVLSCDVVDERHPEFARLVVRGKGVGLALLMDAEIHLEQTDHGAGTSMGWDARLSFAGPSASVGQRVLQPVVEQQMSRAFEALDKRVGELASDGQPG